MTQPVCQSAIDLIKNFEGCRLSAYFCPAHVPTIGYGHTSDVTDDDVANGLTITQDQADQFLADDLAHFADGVDRLIQFDATQNERGSLISFAYNLGLGSLQKSTLLRLANSDDLAGAADQFLAWCHADGRVMAGLVRRRAAERALFLTPDGDAQ